MGEEKNRRFRQQPAEVRWPSGHDVRQDGPEGMSDSEQSSPIRHVNRSCKNDCFSLFYKYLYVLKPKLQKALKNIFRSNQKN